MKRGKICSCMVAAVLSLSLLAGMALAADKSQGLKRRVEKLGALIGENECKALMQNVALYKQAGLSYQPSLMVPVEGVIGCKDKEPLRIIMGMYTFDANYALLFGKKKEYEATDALLRRDIPERLNLGGKLKIQTLSPDERRKIAEDPNDPANREVFTKYIVANLRSFLQEAQSDQEIMVLMVDSLYGSVIQSLYVACKLALAAGSGSQLIALFNDQARRVDKTLRVLDVFADDPYLAGLVGHAEREPVLKPVFDLLSHMRGNLTEGYVKAILARVEPERSKVIARCK